MRHAVRVAATPAEAFEGFVRGFSRWWPAPYTWSGDVLETIAIEPREGGRCFERGPRGFELDWGKVLEYSPPERLRFSWQISPRRVPEPDPERASEVEVRFTGEPGGVTRVDLVHRGFLRHGEEGPGYRDAMGSDQGWPLIMERYARSLG